jgi:glycosyltransferase involved in cell wall biosynthesis
VSSSTGPGHDVWVVDPSLFTLPYDHELCQALQASGLRVRLIGRSLRAEEATVSPPRYEFEPLFYRRSESTLSESRRGFRRLGKGLEHMLGNLRLDAASRRRSPSVVHFQWLALPWADGPLLAAMKRRCPLVLTVHDATAHGGRGFSPVQTGGLRRALRHFAAFIVHNREGQKALADLGIDEASVEVLSHPPLPLPPFESTTPPDPAEPVLMIFGEIKPYKGVDLAIEALAKLPDRFRGKVRLVVAGRPGMPTSGLRALARKLGVEARVEWVDRYLGLDELPAILGTASIFLLPYRNSDASGVLTQVLQLGRPVVASRTGVFPALVGETGCGVVVEPEDPCALADAVSRLLDDPDRARRMGDAARELSRTMPGWRSAATRHRSIYDRARRTWAQGAEERS